MASEHNLKARGAIRRVTGIGMEIQNHIDNRRTALALDLLDELDSAIGDLETMLREELTEERR